VRSRSLDHRADPVGLVDFDQRNDGTDLPVIRSFTGYRQAMRFHAESGQYVV
jgi:hypothetical protein